MGERGKGAKPRRVLTEAETKQRARKRPWERKGLSRADRVIRFIEMLKITSGKFAGKPFKLRPWQKEFIRKVYAIDSNGLRLVRTAVLSMARKNGKTQLAAAIALCHLVGPECEPRSEVYSCANDTEQAGKLFDEMWAMIRSDERLDDETNVISFRKEIKHYPTEGQYRAVSADDKTKLGLNPSCVIYDELGAAKNRKLFDAFETAMGGREEPLFLIISTQADSDFAPMSEQIDYGLQVQADIIHDPTFHLTLYAAPPDIEGHTPLRHMLRITPRWLHAGDQGISGITERWDRALLLPRLHRVHAIGEECASLGCLLSRPSKGDVSRRAKAHLGNLATPPEQEDPTAPAIG